MWLIAFMFTFHEITAIKLIQIGLNSLFLAFVWTPISNEIEPTSGSTRYLVSFSINYLFIYVLLPMFPMPDISRILLGFNMIPFAYFESVLICLLNPDRIIQISKWEIPSKKIPLFATIYLAIVNGLFN